MSSSNPNRLRADSDLPRALRGALRELPNADPTPDQLAALRGRLGLGAVMQGVAPFNPLPVLPPQVQRVKARRLGRTVAAFVFFPIAAAAAVGTALEIRQRVQSPVVVASAVALASKPAQRAVPAARVLPTASVLPEPEPAQVAVEPAPSLPFVAPPARLSSSASRLAPAVEADSSAASKPSEVSLLQRANAALKTDPTQALALAAQHRAAFPNGNLGQERDAIIVRAWLALGNVERARTALTSFETAYPHSAYAVELRQAVR